MSQKGKFCFLLPNYIAEAKGGSEIQAYFLAQELRKRGWEVHYIRESSRKRSKEEIIDGIILHSLPPRHTKLKWLNTRLLHKLMGMIKADVWYCRATISYVFPAWLNARKIGGKLIWACSHDAYVTKKMKKEITKESFLRKIASLLDRYLFLMALRKIDLIILQSDHQKKLLKKNWGLEGQVIYNSFPIIPFRGAKREPIIMWIARLQPWKHPEKYIELVRKLHKKHYQFLAVGREMGHPRLTEEFQKTQKEIPAFEYLGEIGRNRIFGYLEKARVLVNTSDYEGFSNTFIEAWLHGVPLVSLKVDPDNLIRENGLGSVSGNMEQLARDVESLMENHRLWEQKSQKCRNFAVKNFNIQDKADDLEQLIENLE
jgi:glycosyltransferase involved in cell wall biosynthesis